MTIALVVSLAFLVEVSATWIAHRLMIPDPLHITRPRLIALYSTGVALGTGMAAVLGWALVLEGLAPWWLLLGVGLGFASFGPVGIISILMHFVERDREAWQGERTVDDLWQEIHELRRKVNELEARTPPDFD